jgi:protein involved in polysaccharide export with SLBB domain
MAWREGGNSAPRRRQDFLPMMRFSCTLLVVAAALGACAGPLAGGRPDEAYYRERDYRAQPLVGSGAVAGRGGYGQSNFADIGYATWQDSEPEYRLYPGDTLDISVLSAPELNRTVTVQPDGRITLPLVPAVMAADRSAPQLQQILAQAYSAQLVRPDISVAVKTTMPLKVFVGGWVDKPGVYDMPGDIDAMQAVIMAGGFKLGAQAQQVAILRRGPGGQAMLRTADLRGGVRGRFVSDSVPRRRFDVIFVPKTGLTELGGFVSQVRDALPFQFSYVIGGQYVSSK